MSLSLSLSLSLSFFPPSQTRDRCGGGEGGGRSVTRWCGCESEARCGRRTRALLLRYLAVIVVGQPPARRQPLDKGEAGGGGEEHTSSSSLLYGVRLISSSCPFFPFRQVGRLTGWLAGKHFLSPTRQAFGRLLAHSPHLRLSSSVFNMNKFLIISAVRYLASYRASERAEERRG